MVFIRGERVVFKIVVILVVICVFNIKLLNLFLKKEMLYLFGVRFWIV